MLQSIADFAWTEFCRKDTDLPNGLDWDVIKTDRDVFVPAQWLDVGIYRPADLPFYVLAALYHRLFESQSGPHAFRWIHRPVTNTSQPITREWAEPIATAAHLQSETLPPPPSTPARQRRVVYRTPSKTPSSRPQATGTPALRLSTLAEGDEFSAESFTTHTVSPPAGNHVGRALHSSHEPARHVPVPNDTIPHETIPDESVVDAAVVNERVPDDLVLDEPVVGEPIPNEPDEPTVDEPMPNEPIVDAVPNEPSPNEPETVNHTPAVTKESGGNKRDTGELAEEEQSSRRSKRTKRGPTAAEEGYAGRRTNARASSNVENVPVTAHKGKERKDSKGKERGKTMAQSASTSAGRVLRSRTAASEAGSAVSVRASKRQRGGRDARKKN